MEQITMEHITIKFTQREAAQIRDCISIALLAGSVSIFCCSTLNKKLSLVFDGREETEDGTTTGCTEQQSGPDF